MRKQPQISPVLSTQAGAGDSWTCAFSRVLTRARRTGPWHAPGDEGPFAACMPKSPPSSLLCLPLPNTAWGLVFSPPIPAPHPGQSSWHEAGSRACYREGKNSPCLAQTAAAAGIFTQINTTPRPGTGCCARGTETMPAKKGGKSWFLQQDRGPS